MKKIFLIVSVLFSCAVFSQDDSTFGLSKFGGTLKDNMRQKEELFHVTRYDFLSCLIFSYREAEANSVPGMLDNAEFLFIKEDSTLFMGKLKLAPTGEKWCLSDGANSTVYIEYIFAPNGMKGEEIFYEFSPEFGLMNIVDRSKTVLCQFAPDNLLPSKNAVLSQCGERAKKYKKMD